jgi:acetyl-CoA acyltransferase
LNEVYVVDALRSPIGRFRGSLAEVRADELLAGLLRELTARNGVDGAQIDDVLMGCVTQVGEQCGNIARTALLSAGFPASVPGMTVDRKCGSGEAAVQVAHARIRSGLASIVLAGGAESMTRVPMGCNRDSHGEAFGPALLERFDLCSQGEAAERISDLWKLSREDHDAFALESHRRAIAAAGSGAFTREILPWRSAGDRGTLTGDETIRFDTSAEKLAGLKRVFREEGRVSAGNASQICDGAAALLLAGPQALQQLGLSPRARIVASVVVGSDPELMLTGPVAATRRVLEEAGLDAADVDLFEVNEAFASVPLVWMHETGIGHDRLNVNGGAIALGHPLGATGARIMTTLLHTLERKQLRFGLQSICCAGGMATATIIERLDRTHG